MYNLSIIMALYIPYMACHVIRQHSSHLQIDHVCRGLLLLFIGISRFLHGCARHSYSKTSMTFTVTCVAKVLHVHVLYVWFYLNMQHTCTCMYINCDISCTVVLCRMSWCGICRRLFRCREPSSVSTSI